MVEFFQSLSTNLQHTVLIVGLPLLAGTVIATVAIIMHYSSKVRLSIWESSLKSQMVERGMTPDDIEKVLKIKSHWSENPEDAEAGVEKKELESDPQAKLAAYLTECWYEGSDVARILEAIQQRPSDAENRKVDFALVRELANQSSEADDIIRILKARQPVAMAPAAAG